MKARMELQLIATQVSDYLMHKEGILFKQSLCTQERVLRFQTPFLCEIFPNSETESGVWKNGCYLMYEIYNESDDFKITCSVSLKGLNSKERKKCHMLIDSCRNANEFEKGLFFLKVWNYSSAARKIDEIMKSIQDFLEIEMPFFEGEVSRWNKDDKYIIKTFPDAVLTEGAMKEIFSNKYERNILARKKCIAVNGTSCKICGFDFGKVYGPEFSGKIHVHHKIPLSEIKEEYIVDPVNDLIPVCPNCHMVLHSKTDGFYTVEEVMEFMKKE